MSYVKNPQNKPGVYECGMAEGKETTFAYLPHQRFVPRHTDEGRARLFTLQPIFVWLLDHFPLFISSFSIECRRVYLCSGEMSNSANVAAPANSATM